MTAIDSLPHDPAWPAGAVRTLAGRRLAWLAAGALASLFAVGGRWDIPLAAWLAPALLLRYVRMAGPLEAALAAWAVSVAGAFFWMYELAVPLQASTTLGSIAFGTVFAAPYLLDRLAAPRLPGWAVLLAFPAARTACEFLMASFSPLGAAYGLSAITQSDDLPLLQLTAVLGPYAIGFVIGGFAVVANRVLEQPNRPGARRLAIAYGAAVALALAGGSLRLGFFPPAGPYVRVAGISPADPALRAALQRLGGAPRSLADLARIAPDQVDAALDALSDSLFADTARAAAAGARVVVWSENAALLRPGDEPAFLARASAAARQLRIYLDVADNVPGVRDETHLFGPDGRRIWTFEKRHPIPGMEPYAPGRGDAPVAVTPFGRLANVICYDADFPALMRTIRADVVLVPGGDWPQMGAVHTLRMARLRAIENGYGLFRQDVNGLSAAFDHQGRVLGVQDTTSGERHVLIADLPAHGAPTLYGLTGDLFAWLCVLAVASLAPIALVRPKRGAG